MARPRTWITLAAVLVLLAVAAALLAPRLLGEARLRAEVERRVSAALGRDVTVRGPVRVSTGAWIEIDLGNVTVAGAPAATASPRGAGGTSGTNASQRGVGGTPAANAVPPLATIERLRASVAAASLLSGPINLGRVRIEGATFHLHVDENGRGSWEGLGSESSEPGGAPSASSTAPRAWALAGLDVERSALRYTDARGGAAYSISDWQATVGRVALPEPFDLQTSFRALAGDAPLGNARIAAKIAADPGAQRYAVEQLVVDGAIVRAAAAESARAADGVAARGADGALPRAAKSIPAKLTIESATYDGRAGTATLRALQTEALGIRVRADGTAADLATQPRVDGTFATEPFDPRAVLTTLDVKLPPMQGPGALVRAQAKGRVVGNAGAYGVESLDATLDGTRLTGRATRASSASTPSSARWVFDLAADRLVVDPYLKPPKLRDKSPVLLPTDLLRSLDVAGTLRVGELVASGVRLKNVTIDLDGESGGADASRTKAIRETSRAKASRDASPTKTTRDAARTTPR